MQRTTLQLQIIPAINYDLNRTGIAELPNSLGEYAEYIFIT